MPRISAKDAKASFSDIAGKPAKGELTTHDRSSLIDYLKRFPSDIVLSDETFVRNPAPSRKVDL